MCVACVKELTDAKRVLKVQETVYVIFRHIVVLRKANIIIADLTGQRISSILSQQC